MVANKKTKRYYWLKLKEDFFAEPRIKKLRRIAGGDTYTVILLKLMLLAVKSEGILIYEGIEDTLALELALKMDEDDKNVEATLIYMQSMSLIQEVDTQTFDIPQVRELTGSESESAKRVRKHRKEKKHVSLQSNALVTQCNKFVTTEKEKELEIDKEIDTEIDTEIEKDELFEQWLKQYSATATNPASYKAAMRKKVLSGNSDAVDTFKEWKKQKIMQQLQEEEQNKINSFDYSQIIGMKLNGKTIKRLVTQEDYNSVHIDFSDGSYDPNINKKLLYQWCKKTIKDI